MNNTLTIIVGLPASGKDFFIKNNIDNALILSSDDLRVELYGYEDQTHNKEVFEEMDRRTRNAGKEDKNVIYNATNINRGRRVALAQEMQKYFKYIKVVVCVCSIKTLLYRNKTREERHLPEDKLKQMIKSFQIPTLYEYHYDDIEYVWTESNRQGFERDKIALLMNYDQHNRHHSENLGIHILRTANYCKENDKAYKAAVYHDLGKPFCKTTDEEGFNHFIGHPNVGAYLYLTDTVGRGFEVDVAMLIEFHDYIFNFQDFESMKKKLENKYPSLKEDFFEALKLLTEGDRLRPKGDV